LLQAIDSSIGDQTGIPAGSPIHVSAPFSVRTAKTPCWTPAETHAVIVVAARLRAKTSHHPGRARGFDLFTVRGGRLDQAPIRPEGGSFFIRSLRVD
jgi:hypothetical protein